MQKARVLEIYSINEQTYQSICSVLGIKPPAALSGAQLNQFDEIRGWMESGECKNYKEAKEKFKLLSEAEEEPSEMSPTIAAIVQNRAEAELNSALAELDSAAQKLRRQVVSAFYQHVAVRSQDADFLVKAQQAAPVEIAAIDIEVAALPEASEDAG